MASKQIQVYVILGIAVLISSSLLIQNAQAEVQALSFISKHEGTAELYLIDSTGQNLRKLETNDAKKGRGHTWSPDGRFFGVCIQRSRENRHPRHKYAEQGIPTVGRTIRV